MLESDLGNIGAILSKITDRVYLMKFIMTLQPVIYFIVHSLCKSAEIIKPV